MSANLKQLHVPYLAQLDRDMPIEDISAALDEQAKLNIDKAPWPAYNYVPSVKFSLAHSLNCVFIKFYVSENAVRARYRQTNDPVFKDSCVEFFIAFNDEEEYYNFEFNCMGTCLGGFGNGKENRTLLPEHVIGKINRWAVMQKTAANGHLLTNWQLTLVIPVEVFCVHDLTSFQGVPGKVNFYKCGDDLPQPHFLAWNNILAEEPNFHLPEFFGEVQFA
ncbi:MAG: carbohydrate-binding family 9-like protein [Adhaeribacter sp.]